MRSAPVVHVIESLEPRLLLAAELVKDINTTNPVGLPSAGVEFHDAYYFGARDRSGTPQIWKSDGTAAGTALVTALPADSADPTQFITAGNRVFFVTNSPLPRSNVGTFELWSSDGTASGTVMLHPVTGAGGLDTGTRGFDLIDVGGTVYFGYARIPTSYQLWKTDGTPTGTVLVKDKFDAQLTRETTTIVGGRLYFTGHPLLGSFGLYTTDGTDAGTRLIKSLFDPPLSYLRSIGSELYFVAGSPSSGTELWKSDGTTEGTALVDDIVPGSVSSVPRDLTQVGSTLYFDASIVNPARQLWKTDGTAAGTVPLTAIKSGFRSITPVGDLSAESNDLLFFASDGQSGRELWISDGTVDGTKELKDINPGPADSVAAPLSNQANPPTVVAPDGALYFAADDGAHGSEIWRTDGTADGTRLVDDLDPGIAGSNPSNLTWALGRLFFTATLPGQGSGLYSTDGTAAGTVLVKELDEDTDDAFHTRGVLTAPGVSLGNGIILFPADDGVHGTELWRSDGTDQGTTLVADLFPGAAPSNPQNLVIVNGAVFFTAADAAGTGIWKSDGTAAGTTEVAHFRSGTNARGPSGLTSVGGTLYFGVYDASVSPSVQLWSSNGTPAGTMMVKVLEGNYDLQPGIDYHGSLLFGAVGYYNTLWRSDGTADGTVAVAAGITSPLTLFHDRLFFISASPSSIEGRVIESDGTLSGTRVLPFTAYEMAAAGDTLVFSSLSQTGSGAALYEFDGQSTPARLGTFSHPQGLQSFGSEVIFQENYHEWRTDGTTAGTLDLGIAGAESLAIGNQVLLAEPDGIAQSDGTVAGTRLVTPAATVGSTQSLLISGDTLFFRGWRRAEGFELWKLDPIPSPPPPTAQVGGPFVVNEGGTVQLNGTGPVDASYEWDLNYDGNPADFHADSIDRYPTFAAGKHDGPSSHLVGLRVSSGGQTSDIATGTVNILDVPPTVDISGGGSVDAGVPYSLHFSYSDPGPDTPLSWTIDWGDGRVITYPGDTSDVSHPYGLGGKRYQIRGTVTDQDGPHAQFVRTPVGLDPTFGAGGSAGTSIGGPGGPWHPWVALQSNGDIIISDVSSTGWQVQRYNRAGQLDPSFGTGGVASVQFPDANVILEKGVFVEPDGGVTVVGSVWTGMANDYWALARFLPDGTPDPGFGNAGKIIVDLGTIGADVASALMQPDGKIVVVGYTSAPAGVVARFNPDGTWDRTFNGTGRLDLTLEPQLCALDGSGNIVVEAGSELGNSPFLLARIKPDGTLDTSFGVAGLAMPQADSFDSSAMAVGPNNEIVLAGKLPSFAPDRPTDLIWKVLRLTADGATDPAFNHGATVTIHIDPTAPANEDWPHAVLVEGDGRILAGGETGPGGSQSALTRLNADGSLDRTFNGTGILEGPTTDPREQINAMALDADGQLITVNQRASLYSTDSISRYIIGGVYVNAPPAVSGAVFDDTNHNGRQDAGEGGLPAATVYLDLNANGRPDDGEPSAVSDASGTYTLLPQVGGTFSVRVIDPAGYRRTAPLLAASQVTVSFGPTTVAGPVFGETTLSAVPLDFAYLLVLAQHYGLAGTFAAGDLNGDDKVDFTDLLLLAQHYGKPLPD